jgi:hypothetical protein
MWYNHNGKARGSQIPNGIVSEGTVERTGGLEEKAKNGKLWLGAW